MEQLISAKNFSDGSDRYSLFSVITSLCRFWLPKQVSLLFLNGGSLELGTESLALQKFPSAPSDFSPWLRYRELISTY